ncbi:MAG: O-methyltransferase [Armatimonadota bacterium]|nr:O-methyltransferase [Armatimonadota bacterium]MDR7558639.1 O-methyltransferase [Armatimonadota bacterium]
MAHELVAPVLARYLDDLVPPRPRELAAMETYGRKAGFPIIGPAAGQFCYVLARLTGARRVFEMGSGYGYSTAWFARAVKDNGGGTVFHVVWDEELSQRGRRHLRALDLDDVVEYRVGEAVAILRETPGPFDLIFNDIDKSAYPASLAVIAEKLRPGGALIVDNGLWGGRVFDRRDRTPATEGVRELTRLLTTDPRWATTLVPIRDGLLIACRQER